MQDLNGPDSYGETYGGVPAIFKAFTLEAGLMIMTSVLELVGGKGLEYWFTIPDIAGADQQALGRGGDARLLHPGSGPSRRPHVVLSSSKQIADMFLQANPQSKL